MQTIGLIGGMSWESTATYYKVINETVKRQLGGFHSAKCVLVSLDFAEVEAAQTSGDWARGAALLLDAARRLEAAGADFFLICTNTMHKVADEVAAGVSIPLLHIADVTAGALKDVGVRTAALLGTKYTMEQPFYTDRLRQHGIEVLLPNEADRALINHVIFNELCLGIQSQSAKAAFEAIAAKLAAAGAEGVVLGCTEIGLLLPATASIDTAQNAPCDPPSALPIHSKSLPPLFDTALLHARAAALRAMQG